MINLTAAARRTEPHEVNDACHTLHCYAHQVDEPDPIERRGGTACGECNHAYRTGRDLRRAYIRGALELIMSDLRAPAPPISPFTDLVLGPNGLTTTDDPIPGGIRFTALPPPNWWDRHPRAAALRRLIRLPFTRTRDITFCPHCIHDL